MSKLMSLDGIGLSLVKGSALSLALALPLASSTLERAPTGVLVPEDMKSPRAGSVGKAKGVPCAPVTLRDCKPPLDS